MSYLDELKLLTAWDTEPELTEDHLNVALADASLNDVDGRSPTDLEWVPTYDLNAAAAKVWLIKAARAAATVDSPSSGEVTAKVFDNCRAMARIYSAKRSASVAISTDNG